MRSRAGGEGCWRRRQEPRSRPVLSPPRRRRKGEATPFRGGFKRRSWAGSSAPPRRPPRVPARPRPPPRRRAAPRPPHGLGHRRTGVPLFPPPVPVCVLPSGVASGGWSPLKLPPDRSRVCGRRLPWSCGSAEGWERCGEDGGGQGALDAKYLCACLERTRCLNKAALLKSAALCRGWVCSAGSCPLSCLSQGVDTRRENDARVSSIPKYTGSHIQEGFGHSKPSAFLKRG